MKRSIKSIETGNKDLEDQIFQLTNENQKLKHDNMKTKLSEIEYKENRLELVNKLENLKNEKVEVEEKLKEVEQKEKVLEEKNKVFQYDGQLTTKKTTLLSAYEKLLIKLLHQRKEMLQTNHVVHDHTALKVSSLQSIEYKNLTEIEDSVKTTFNEADTTFVALSSKYQDAEKERKCHLNFFRELSECLCHNDEKDSCYSTDGDVTETLSSFLPGRDISEGKRGISALKASKVDVLFSDEVYLSKLLASAKKLVIQQEAGNQEMVEVSRKWKSSKRRLKQLHIKLKSRRRLKHNMKNKISQLKKELKVLKELHRSFHNKMSMSSSPQNPAKTSTVSSPRSPAKCLKTNNALSYLESGEKELEIVRTSLESRDEKVIGEGLDKLKHILSQISEHLPVCSCDGDKLLCDGGEEKESSFKECDKLNERFGVLQDQRQYMLDHLTFTNKRLEVLLNCLKGHDTTTTDDNNNKFQPDTSNSTNREATENESDNLLNRIKK